MYRSEIAPAPDAALYRRALSQLDSFADDQLQTQLRAAHRTLQSLQGAERRELLEQQLSVRVADQMTTLRTSPSVRRFMTGTWAKVLAEAMLQHGDQAETTRGYIKLVDELLWSLQVPDHPQSRQRRPAGRRQGRAVADRRQRRSLRLDAQLHQ